eukprot:CAMPEP_0175950462 /NCGR_PEP_ID=MMETSP0108-20121206/29626_1 /TAXON_ID=195067 ORGANISM="Goniomonas pacifica, Strain CCMP1869" /NCGR_SAMPLE_ID=MMETSP0108 /ASSEMBLY_ACC=CAM_ASM_000204 /LENGTH=155 /DNA_ID=CAMNT_0017276549 /DNA_START=584 /DNA_END=1051 /DNA_ORIENTATION=-
MGSCAVPGSLLQNLVQVYFRLFLLVSPFSLGLLSLNADVGHLCVLRVAVLGEGQHVAAKNEIRLHTSDYDRTGTAPWRCGAVPLFGVFVDDRFIPLVVVVVLGHDLGPHRVLGLTLNLDGSAKLTLKELLLDVAVVHGGDSRHQRAQVVQVWPKD